MQREMSDILNAITKEQTQKSSTIKKEAQTAQQLIEQYSGKEKEFYQYIKEKKLAQLPFIKSLQEIPVKNRLFFQSLQVLHKLITRNSISQDFIPYILEEFEKKIQAHPEVQLRVLQLLQPLTEDPLLVKGSNLQKLFKIGIQLIKASKDAGACKITVFYVVECIFERVGAFNKESSEDLANKESAEQDCLVIMKISLEAAKGPEILGLDLLLTCVSNKFSKDAISSPGGAELLEKTIDFIMKEITEKDAARIKTAFAICIKILTNVIMDKHAGLSILLEIKQAEMLQENEVLKEEFIYALPHHIVMECLKSSKELSEEIFDLEREGPLLDIIRIGEGQKMLLAIQEKEKNNVSESKSLKMTKIVEIACTLKDPEILPLFIPYFIYLIENISCSTETWPADTLSKLKSAVENLVDGAKNELGILNMLIRSLYTAAEKYPRVFFNLAFKITFLQCSTMTEWKEFFALCSRIQDSTPELNSWNSSIERLMKSDPACLRVALQGGCQVANIPLSRFLALFFSIGHRIEDFPCEAIEYIEKIFFPGTETTKSTAEEQVVYFFNEYFKVKFTEKIHIMIFPEIVRIFSLVKNQNRDISLAKTVLQAISDGIKRTGEALGKGWVSLYEMLMDAAEEEDLRRIVFETIKVITERMLLYLPDGCLISTHKLLCMCCKLIIEDNISFQALFSIRDLTEYIHTEKDKVSREQQIEIFHATMCLLCSVGYDQRDDVRDSAIVQAFETIYFCQRLDLLPWDSLITIFLKRLLSAAVYAKEKEIYSGEYDEKSSDSDDLPTNGTCVCKGVGGCFIPPYTTESHNTARSLESAKKILLGVSSLVFNHFEEMKEHKGFYSLWKYIGRIFVKFFADPNMKSTVILAASPGLQSSLPPKYRLSLFATISDICFLYTQTEDSLETLVEMLKQSYRSIQPESKNSEHSTVFFKTITHLLKNSTVEENQALTFLEFEALESLKSESSQTAKIKVLLEWIPIPHTHPEKISEQFVVQCIEQLEKEILVHKDIQTDERSESIRILLMYHKKKDVQVLCWNRAMICLQRILELEAQSEGISHLKLISCEIFGLPSEEIDDIHTFPKPAIQSKATEQRIKKEERSIQDHLVFLEALTEILKDEKVMEVYTVVRNLWDYTVRMNLHILHLTTTKTLCRILTSKKELAVQAEDWIDCCLQNYNASTRIERSKHSFFQRQAALYVLQQILSKKMPIPKSKKFLPELILCISSDAPDVSTVATEVLEYFVSNK
ncbi:hypothetical protein NEAUS05_1803 [Nematocida ausubeli]|nr:hypothetical protein NEAUS06_0505 [Nematocida ausubeli]KAI5136817.1 hypothetical protein NEAUS07_1714 [Nematocida ausubeli]KAI5149515.1 hypothetical protein NEAUS05_1803 [Nematocida ausubeli]